MEEPESCLGSSVLTDGILALQRQCHVEPLLGQGSAPTRHTPACLAWRTWAQPPWIQGLLPELDGSESLMTLRCASGLLWGKPGSVFLPSGWHVGWDLGLFMTLQIGEGKHLDNPSSQRG